MYKEWQDIATKNRQGLVAIKKNLQDEERETKREIKEIKKKTGPVLQNKE